MDLTLLRQLDKDEVNSWNNWVAQTQSPRSSPHGRSTVSHTRGSLRRASLPDLPDGFLYACLDGNPRQAAAAAYRQWTLAHFSGTLCIDELHLGRRTLLLATDPLNDFPVAFALVSRNDQEH